MAHKSVTVNLHESTHRWLTELAKANSGTQLNPNKVTPAELLRQAAVCFADFAGRRPGSWEAEAARQMLLPSGYGTAIGALKQDKLREQEARRKS